MGQKLAEAKILYRSKAFTFVEIMVAAAAFLVVIIPVFLVLNFTLTSGKRQNLDVELRSEARKAILKMIGEIMEGSEIFTFAGPFDASRNMTRTKYLMVMNLEQTVKCFGLTQDRRKLMQYEISISDGQIKSEEVILDGGREKTFELDFVITKNHFVQIVLTTSYRYRKDAEPVTFTLVDSCYVRNG